MKPYTYTVNKSDLDAAGTVDMLAKLTADFAAEFQRQHAALWDACVDEGADAQAMRSKAQPLYMQLASERRGPDR